MVRKHITGFLLAALLLVAANARAADDLAAQSDFFREGQSARAFGMGSAFVGVADDTDAVYWNPAGLAQLKGPQFITTKTTLDFFDSDVQSFSAAMPYGPGAFGINYVYSNTDIPLYGQNPANPLRFNYFLGMASERYTGIALAYAMQYQPNIALGLSIKNMKYSLYGNSASGTGFDLSAFMKLESGLNVGLNLQNLGGVSLGAMDEVPTNFQLGVSQKFMEDALTLALGYDSNYLGDSSFSIGTEYKVADHVIARLGSSDSKTAYGFSIDYESFRFDYGLNSGGDETESSKFSLAYSFAPSAPRPKKAEKKAPPKEEPVSVTPPKEDKKDTDKDKQADKDKKADKDKDKDKDKKADKDKDKDKDKKAGKDKDKKDEAAAKPVEPAAAPDIRVTTQPDTTEEDEQPEELPGITTLLGQTQPTSTSTGTAAPYQPAPQRFPTSQGGYSLDSEVEQLP